jgi:hypothetical protein
LGWLADGSLGNFVDFEILDNFRRLFENLLIFGEHQGENN